MFLLFFVVWSCWILFCCLLLLLLSLLLLLVLWWWWWRWCDDRDCNSYTVDSWQRLSLVTILMMNILAMVVAMMILMIINITTTITIIKIMIIIAVMILIVAMTIDMINTSITQCEHLMMHMFQHISSIYLYVHHVCLTTDWPLQMKRTLSVRSFPHVPDATPDQLCLLLFATKAFGLPQTTSSCIYHFHSEIILQIEIRNSRCWKHQADVSEFKAWLQKISSAV